MSFLQPIVPHTITGGLSTPVCRPFLTRIAQRIQVILNIGRLELTHYPALKIFKPGSGDSSGIKMDQLRLVRLNSRDGKLYFPEIIYMHEY